MLVFDVIYVINCWTSDDCDGQVDLEVTLVRRTNYIISLFRPLYYPCIHLGVISTVATLTIL